MKTRSLPIFILAITVVSAGLNAQEIRSVQATDGSQLTEKSAVDDNVAAKDAFQFETVGLYVSLPTDLPPTDPGFYDFLASCGYNYLEFCEAGFRWRADLLP